jgi:hypothetical protein
VFILFTREILFAAAQTQTKSPLHTNMFATWFRQFTAEIMVRPRTFVLTVPLLSELRHITIKNIAIVKGALVIKGSYK